MRSTCKQGRRLLSPDSIPRLCRPGGFECGQRVDRAEWSAVNLDSRSAIAAPGTSPLTDGGHVTAESASASQSPRKPKGLSQRIFECLVVEASAQAQDHLSVLADRYTERCCGVFDCTGDGQCDDFGSLWTRWPRHFGVNSGRLLPKTGVVGWSLMRLDRFDASSGVSGLDQHAAGSEATDFVVQGLRPGF